MQQPIAGSTRAQTLTRTCPCAIILYYNIYIYIYYNIHFYISTVVCELTGACRRQKGRARCLVAKGTTYILQRCRMHLYSTHMYYTVWPEILAGNLFWRIGGFESNPPIFHPPKTSV